MIIIDLWTRKETVLSVNNIAFSLPSSHAVITSVCIALKNSLTEEIPSALYA
jgi:hypothetical protein